MTDKDHLTLVRPGCTPPASSQPAILTAETEAELAAALDQAVATGLPVQAPVEVLRAFGVPECDDESAEAADWLGRPDLALIPERHRRVVVTPRRRR